jgi:predicted amidophosphoribosyltransferase
MGRYFLVESFSLPALSFQPFPLILRSGGTAMKCPNCRTENREGVKFCEQCGAKLEQQCPNCKARIPLDSNFCGGCGHDLRTRKQAPSIDYNQPQSYTPKFLAEKILTTRDTIEGP